MDWRTHPAPVRPGPLPWWKQDTGEACPHGLAIYLVCGSRVRNLRDSDFDQGGNGYAYNFIPKDEIWIDDHVPEEERPFVAFHECHEAEDMRRGMSYDEAHVRAKRLEDKLRRVLRPGEPRR
jgi:hypothetical protein